MILFYGQACGGDGFSSCSFKSAHVFAIIVRFALAFFFSFALLFYWGFNLFGVVYKFAGPRLFLRLIKEGTVFTLFQHSGVRILPKLAVTV